MTLKQLYYLLEVNTRQSVTAAAEALDISPAGLSKAVSELEGELGIKIFERSNKGSRLTADGERVLALAREITAKADELLNLTAGEKRTLRLITYSQFSSDLLISTAADLLSASEVELTQKSVSEYGSPIDTITEQLARSEYDAAVISLTPQLCSRLEQRLEIRVLERSRLCVIVSASSELARRDYLSPEQLRSVFFIPGSDQYFEDEMEEVLSPFRLNRYPLTTDSPSVIGEIVSSGVAARLCSEQRGRIDSYIKNGSVRLIPILKDGRYIDMNYICAFSPDSPVRYSCERFIERLTERFG